MTESSRTSSLKRSFRIDSYPVFILLAASAFMSWRTWCKLNSLTWLDPPWWLNECARFARGEVPYRDFSWPYPPFALALFGTCMRWFGVRFSVAEALMDLFSLAIVLLSYRILLYLVPRAYALAGCLLLIAVCGTSQTYFSLFSLMSYAPVLQVSTAALLLFIWGILRYLEFGRLSGWTLVMLAVGSGISMASKQEPIIAVPPTLLLLATVDRQLWFRERSWAQWLRHYTLVAIACVVPALAVFLYTGRVAGFPNMMAGVSGYGMAVASCPWWPTGVGLFAAGAGIGQLLLFAAACAFFFPTEWKRWLRRYYPWFLVAVVVGLLLYAGYEYYEEFDDLHNNDPLTRKLFGLISSALATTDVLRPFLWGSILYWIVLVWRAARDRGRVLHREAALLLLLAVPVLMGSRSLFGNSTSPDPNVTAMCYPILLMLAPYFLLRMFHLPNGRPVLLRLHGGGRVASLLIFGMFGLYIAARLIGGFDPVLSDRRFGRLDTQAGPVWVKEQPVYAEIYKYILENTKPEDPVLEIPDGGGISFATGRQSPIFSTILRVVPTPLHFQSLDLTLLREHPPAVIIAKDALNYETSMTTPEPVTCPAPRFVWKPEPDPNLDSSRTLLIVDFIHTNYRIDRKVGQWLLLRPLPGPSH